MSRPAIPAAPGLTSARFDAARQAPTDAGGESTRARALSLLKGQPGSSVQHVAQQLGVSVPAARKHLSNLEEGDLIAAETCKPGGRGRPQRVYRLTERGEAHFPKSYATLCADVLSHLDTLFGEGAVLRVLDQRRAKLAATWAPQLRGPLPERVGQLAALLNAAGYHALAYQEGAFLYLEQGNCPNLEVARQFDELCGAEIELYRELLDAPVHRESRIACGAASCRYRVG